MRISDWSSDVCSSVLVLSIIIGAEQPLLLAGRGEEDDRAARLGVRFGEGARDLEHHRDARGIIERAVVDPILVGCIAGLGVGDPDMVELRGQTGRASCRESECQYGLISVVAVAFKKTKKNTK